MPSETGFRPRRAALAGGRAPDNQELRPAETSADDQEPANELREWVCVIAGWR